MSVASGNSSGIPMHVPPQHIRLLPAMVLRSASPSPGFPSALPYTCFPQCRPQPFAPPLPPTNPCPHLQLVHKQLVQLVPLLGHQPPLSDRLVLVLRGEVPGEEGGAGNMVGKRPHGTYGACRGGGETAGLKGALPPFLSLAPVTKE